MSPCSGEDTTAAHADRTGLAWSCWSILINAFLMVGGGGGRLNKRKVMGYDGGGGYRGKLEVLARPSLVENPYTDKWL